MKGCMWTTVSLAIKKGGESMITRVWLIREHSEARTQ